MAQILDGKLLSKKILRSLKHDTECLACKGLQPRLDILVAAQDPASQSYVRMKQKRASELGIASQKYEMTLDFTQEDAIALIRSLNANAEVHGVLIQHPLPPHLDIYELLLHLGGKKDVDGMSPESLGRLACGLPGFRCATPLGMMAFLQEYKIPTQGKNALVIGRSIIVGKPAALMLLEKHATVTIAHSRTEGLRELCLQADILVTGVGKAELVKGDWIKLGASILDAGSNCLPGRKSDVGDVEFESAYERAGWITPVPGGVGPMTVASLMRNVVDAAKKTMD